MTTIRDVAREASVSIATVSRVISGSQAVSQATTQRVLEATARLDYMPNSAARSLSSKRAHALGVLLPDLYGEFFSEVIRGIDHSARARGFQILVSSSHANTRELVAAARSMRGRVDGLIAMAPNIDLAEAVRDVSRHFPVTLLNPGFAVDGCRAVSVANFEGAYAMVRHLAALGHRRIAMIKGPERNFDADERHRGYIAALRDLRLDADPDLQLPGDFTESSGFDSAVRILDLESPPTAVFAANDCMAIGLISALLEAGVSVPQKISVAGFDDIAIARYLNPPLTTVHVDAYDLGQRAVWQWFAFTAQSPSDRPPIEVIPTSLVTRSSCSPPAQTTELRRPALRRTGGREAGR